MSIFEDRTTIDAIKSVAEARFGGPDTMDETLENLRKATADKTRDEILLAAYSFAIMLDYRKVHATQTPNAEEPR